MKLADLSTPRRCCSSQVSAHASLLRLQCRNSKTYPASARMRLRPPPTQGMIVIKATKARCKTQTTFAKKALICSLSYNIIIINDSTQLRGCQRPGRSIQCQPLTTIPKPGKCLVVHTPNHSEIDQFAFHVCLCRPANHQPFPGLRKRQDNPHASTAPAPFTHPIDTRPAKIHQDSGVRKSPLPQISFIRLQLQSQYLSAEVYRKLHSKKNMCECCKAAACGRRVAARGLQDAHPSCNVSIPIVNQS